MIVTRRALLTGSVAALVALRARGAGAELGVDEILRRADAVRNPAESYFLRVTVETSDAPGSLTELEVMLSGNTRTLIRTVRPPKDRGRSLLMIGEDMWAYIPSLRRAVRVSLGQRLVGQAANGDIARMRWSGDYAATLEAGTDREHCLLLVATKKGLTYERLRVWIERDTFRPLRADLMTPQGRPLKRATYGGYRAICGSVRPTEIAIRDAVREADVSTIRVLEMRVQTFPASMFTPEALP